MKLRSLFVMMVGAGLCFLLVGCEDESNFQRMANEKLAIAQRQLQEARDMEAPVYANEFYSLAEIKYTEGKQHMDEKQYSKAFRDWEDFEFLISKAESETKLRKSKVAKVEPKVEAPKVEVKVEPPKVEAPVVQAPKVEVAPVKKRSVWVVKRGDHLYKISRQLYNNNFRRWSDIYQINKPKIKHPHWIFPGQEFELPQD